MGWQWALLMLLGGVLVGELPSLLASLFMPSPAREVTILSLIGSALWLAAMLAGFHGMSLLVAALPYIRAGVPVPQAFSRAWRVAQGAARPGARGPGPRSRSEHFAAVSHTVLGLPTELYHSPAELAALPAGELRVLLRRARIDPGVGPLEKEDLVRLLLERADTSSQQCSICFEDYAPGDVLRVLPECRHKFHLECVDRWFLSSADGNKEPLCPMCNTPLRLT
ncbi:hypothetical protein QBZ16_003843 [Prototheca wickerhamii]|uniref:RING-type domain-containing protein n=1 Tax=Prototheca wickerhamii TaxID=3111 RepID=A0AAD9IJV2_PROWI|nr:hypothetical protein QBZ16_003843 [Prototheca wickerhamii]